MSNLRFANDAVLMDEKKDSINELVRRVNTDGERRLLKINVKKTKGMTIGSNTIPYEVKGELLLRKLINSNTWVPLKQKTRAAQRM